MNAADCSLSGRLIEYRGIVLSVLQVIAAFIWFIAAPIFVPSIRSGYPFVNLPVRCFLGFSLFLALVVYRKPLISAFKQEREKGHLIVAVLLLLAVAALYTGECTRICSIVVMVLLVYGLLRLRRTKRLPLLPAFIWLLWGYFLLQAAGLFRTSDVKYGLHLLQSQLPLVLFPAALWLIDLHRTDFRWLWRAIFIIGQAYLLATLLQYTFLIRASGESLFSALTLNKFYFPGVGEGSLLPIYNVVRWAGYTHPTYLMLCLAAPAIVAIVRYFNVYDNRSQIPGDSTGTSIPELCFYAGLLLAFAFTLQSRITMLIVPIAIFLQALFWCYRRFKRHWLGMAVIPGMVLFCVTLLSTLSIFTDPVRRGIYEAALASIFRHPWGLGTGSLPGTLHAAGIPTEHMHPHNQLLAELMQGGLLAGVYLLVMVLGVYLTAWRRRNYALLLFFSLLILVMAIESPLSYVRGIWDVSLLLPLVALMPTGRGSTNPCDQSRS